VGYDVQVVVDQEVSLRGYGGTRTFGLILYDGRSVYPDEGGGR
jgi:hypothetical protein